MAPLCDNLEKWAFSRVAPKLRRKFVEFLPKNSLEMGFFEKSFKEGIYKAEFLC